MEIAIDIGHANGTGARGNGLEEHAVCTVIGQRLRRLLEGEGHRVGLIDFAEKSNREDLEATIVAINSWSYDFGVSLHCDCSDRPSARGAHVCYYSSGGRKLAAAISKPLTALLPGRAHAVQHRPKLAILSRTRPRMVLVENGFISNEGDAEMQRRRYEEIAEAIFVGIKDYIERLNS